MQEEVENRTVNLVISTSRLTMRNIVAGVRMYLQHRTKVNAARAAGKKNVQEEIPHGKQTVKQLIGQNQGVSNVEVTGRNIKLFEKVAGKYGVDFAVKKDKIQLKDDKIASLREQVKKLEDDKKKLIVQLVDYEELKSENERLKKQLAKK